MHGVGREREQKGHGGSHPLKGDRQNPEVRPLLPRAVCSKCRVYAASAAACVGRFLFFSHLDGHGAQLHLLDPEHREELDGHAGCQPINRVGGRQQVWHRRRRQAQPPLPAARSLPLPWPLLCTNKVCSAHVSQLFTSLSTSPGSVLH